MIKLDDKEKIMSNSLDTYYIKNTKETFNALTTRGYDIKEDSYTNRDYYMKYPYLLCHNGHIEFCHNRHLNREDLYGKNKEMFYIDGIFTTILL